MSWLIEQLEKIMSKRTYHDPKNDCPTNKKHCGMRAKEREQGDYMLVCAECGTDIRLANPVGEQNAES